MTHGRHLHASGFVNGGVYVFGVYDNIRSLRNLSEVWFENGWEAIAPTPDVDVTRYTAVHQSDIFMT